MDLSLATPMTRPFLPRISSPVGKVQPSAMLRSSCSGALFRASAVETRHDQAAVGAAEPEAVAHHVLELDVLPLAQDRHALEGGVQLLDVRALRGEALLHHQEAVDGLLRAGRAQA